MNPVRKLTKHIHSINTFLEKSYVSFSRKHFKFSNRVKNNQEGFIALISILIIGAIMLAISIGLSLRSIGETNMSLAEQESHRALALANLCAEQALMKLESTLDYAGGEPITIGSESCDILTISGSGNFNRTVKTQSAVSGYTKKVRVEVSQISPTMQITSWEEVGDF